MAQVINTNVPSLNAQNNLNKTNAGLTQALERLSSGKRINSAKDDAAGIAIASRFTAQIRGFNQGTRNAADAISLVQTAESSLEEVTQNLQRLRELGIQASNETNSTSDRAALQVEVTQLQAEIVRVGGTQFNGSKALGGTASYQVGADIGATENAITVSTHSLAGMSGFSGAAGSAGVTEQTSALHLVSVVDVMLQSVNTTRAKLGAVQSRFESTIRNNDNLTKNLSDARSRIEDADFAKETAKLTKFQILQQAGISVLSQANSMPQSVLGLLG